MVSLRSSQEGILRLAHFVYGGSGLPEKGAMWQEVEAAFS